MAHSDVYKLRDQAYSDLLEWEDVLVDYTDESMRTMVTPEMIEFAEDRKKHAKDTFEQISYFIYLLNMPKRKSKKAKYQRQNEKLLKSIPKWDSQSIHEENEKEIESFREELHK